MRRILPFLLLAACSGDKDDTLTPSDDTDDTGAPTDTDADADADTDADTDADADTDSDTDSDTDTDTGTPALGGSIRVVHVAPTLAPLSVFNPPVPSALINGMPPLTATSWSTIPAGLQTISLGPTGGTPADEWARPSVTVAVGARYSLVLAGSEGAIDARVVEENVAGIPVDEVRLVVWNVGEELAPFDVRDTAAGTVLVDDATYGSGPTEVLAPAGELDIGVDLDGDGTSDVAFTVPDVGDQVTVPLYFLVDGTDMVMLGHAPTGSYSTQRGSLGSDTGATGHTGLGTGDTASTGDTSSATGHTGGASGDTADTAAGHTGDTAAGHTGDTGP